MSEAYRGPPCPSGHHRGYTANQSYTSRHGSHPTAIDRLLQLHKNDITYKLHAQGRLIGFQGTVPMKKKKWYVLVTNDLHYPLWTF